MAYTLKTLLLGLVSICISTDCHDIECEELMENIIYEGVFYDGLDDSALRNPFLESVTAYVLNEELYVIAKDSRGDFSVYCKVSNESWDSFSEKCADCSYSKKFSEYIEASACDCQL